jgi:hypothetical protein
MNMDSAAPLVKDAQPAGASFLEILTGTQSSMSSNGSLAQAPDSFAQEGSTTASQSEQANTATDTTAENPEIAANDKANDNLWSGLAAPTLKPAAAQPVSSQAQTRPHNNGTDRAVDHQQKSQPPAATVPAPATLPNPQPTTVDSLPVPFSASSVPNADQAVTQNPTAADGTVRVSEKTSGSQADLPERIDSQSGPERIDSQNGNKLQTSTRKPADAKSSPDTDSATQSSEAESSQTAGLDTDANTEPSSNSPGVPSAFTLPAGLILPGMNLMPGLNDPTPMNGAPPNKAPDASLAKVAGTTDVKKTNDSSAGAATSSASPNNVTNSNQPVQRPQADSAQLVPAAAKTTDNGASQIATPTQAIANHSAGHEVTTSHGRSDGTTDTVRSTDQPDLKEMPETTAASGINAANVIQKMSETEMRVGMHSADFGDVSIRTSVSQLQMTAQISVDHGDLGKAISAHIPAMEAKLGGDLGLRALVEVNQSGMSFSGERSFSSPKEQQSFAQPAQSQSNFAVLPETDQPALSVAATAGQGYRLDIRA